jgi:hypothetical protein
MQSLKAHPDSTAKKSESMGKDGGTIPSASAAGQLSSASAAVRKATLLMRRDEKNVLALPGLGATRTPSAKTAATAAVTFAGLALEESTIHVPQVQLVSCVEGKETAIHPLIGMSAPFPRTAEIARICLRNDSTVMPPDMTKWLLWSLSMPLLVQKKQDCIDFANGLMRRHPCALVQDRHKHVSLKAGPKLAARFDPFGCAIEFLETRKVIEPNGKVDSQVRVCHSAIWVGEGQYFSKLGLMPSYPLLTYGEMLAIYPTAERVRLVEFIRGCFACGTKTKPTSRCTECWSAQYCGDKCRIADIKQHAKNCRRPLSASERGIALLGVTVPGASTPLSVTPAPGAKLADLAEFMRAVSDGKFSPPS